VLNDGKPTIPNLVNADAVTEELRTGFLGEVSASDREELEERLLFLL
jgi:hypothetical protein